MKKIILLILVLLLSFSGCSSERDKKNLDASIKFTDDLGHEVLTNNIKNVAAASGSFAQIWLLAGGTLAGVTQDALDKDFINADTVIDIGALHEPSLERIIELNPDLLILSADIPAHVKLYDSLNAVGIAVTYFSVENFEDYLNMLKICSDITGRNDLYEENGVSLKDRIEEIILQTAGKPSPKILLLRAGSGKVTVRNSDTMAGAMLKDFGCVNIADNETSLLDNLSMEVIIAQDPDFIFATSMGDEENAQKALQDTLLSNPAWANLSAVKNGRYVLLNKDLFHQKPNNRWAQAYEILWGILYGE